MNLKLTISLAVLLWSFTTLPLSAQSKSFGQITYSKAINIAGKQRMLSQKMAKSYMLIAKGINAPEINKELNTSKFIFEKQLEILKKNANNTTTKLSIKNIEKLWKPFKALLMSPPSLENALQIINTNTPLLNASHDLVVSIKGSASYNSQFFNNTNKDLIAIINTSGRQRMLAQRLCLYYTACTIFNENNQNYKNILNEVFEEFNNAIGNLLIQSDNTTEIEEELGYVMSVWEQFQLNKVGLNTNTFPLEEVFSISNALTKSFNKITGWYEKIAN